MHWVAGAKNCEDPLFGLHVSPHLIEYGTLPLDQQVAGGKATEEVWARNMELALEGDWDNMTPSHQVLHRRAYEEYVVRKKPKPKDLTWRRGKTPNLWVYGPTGTGKSHYVRSLYPDLYEKTPDKWWEDYEGEDAILYEDIGHFHAGYLGDHLKRTADIYRFRAHRKFGSRGLIRPQVVVVTSNYTPAQLWPDPSMHLPLMDRFKLVELTEVFVHPDDIPPPVVQDQNPLEMEDYVPDSPPRRSNSPEIVGSDRWFREHERELARREPYPMFPVVREMAEKYPGFKVTRADAIPVGPLAKIDLTLDSDSEAEESEAEGDIQYTNEDEEFPLAEAYLRSTFSSYKK